MLKKQLKTFKKYRFLLRELVKKGIKLKYRRSYLGILWTLLEPLLTTCVLTIVFGTFFGKDDKTFPVYILTGRLLYSFFSSGTKAAMKSIRQHAGMIKKVYVPKYIYPLSSVLGIRCIPESLGADSDTPADNAASADIRCGHDTFDAVGILPRP